MDVQELYQAHKSMVYHLALSYMKSRPDAEDICQSVFLKLLERQESVRPGKERAWLAAVTANLCRDQLRAARRRRTEPLTEELSFETEEQADIFWAVMALSVRERVPVYLHYYEGYSTREIAGILHISQTAVTSRLSRARRHLRDLLSKEDER